MISVKANLRSVAESAEPVDTAASRPLVIITNRADMALTLANRRRDLGMTCEELDARAGFPDRYTGKLEHPEAKSGKKALHISAMGEVWIQALGFRLCLVPVERLEELGAVPAPTEPNGRCWGVARRAA